MAPTPVEGYVVVTIYGDIVHTYGADDGSPFPHRAAAIALVRRLRREDVALNREPADVVMRTCKVLGAAPDGA